MNHKPYNDTFAGDGHAVRLEQERVTTFSAPKSNS
jgi:hypothetical protein